MTKTPNATKTAASSREGEIWLTLNRHFVARTRMRARKKSLSIGVTVPLSPLARADEVIE
jgi:hypothetical protein